MSDLRSVAAEVWSRRELLFVMVSRDLRARYKGSALGILWSLILPLLMMGIYTFVFRYVMRVQIEYYNLYFLSAFLPWLCFQTSLLNGMVSIVANGELVKKVSFPREILPGAVVFSNLVHLVLGLVMFFIVAAVQGHAPHATIVYLPVLMLIQLVLNLGLTLLAATAFVYARDFEHVLNMLLMAWFYATPIIYDPSMLPDKFRAILAANPMSPIVTAYRQVLFAGEAPDGGGLAMAAATGVVILLLGTAVFRSASRRFADEL